MSNKILPAAKRVSAVLTKLRLSSQAIRQKANEAIKQWNAAHPNSPVLLFLVDPPAAPPVSRPSSPSTPAATANPQHEPRGSATSARSEPHPLLMQPLAENPLVPHLRSATPEQRAEIAAVVIRDRELPPEESMETLTQRYREAASPQARAELFDQIRRKREAA